MNDLLYVGFCPICGQGRQLVFRELASENYYIACEDCESEWRSPDAIEL